MAFSFKSFNTEKMFDINTRGFEYYKLKDLYELNGANAVYKLCGCYIGTKSFYNDEEAVIATEDCYVNLPHHQLAQIKKMMSDPRAVSFINKGSAGFTIETYTGYDDDDNEVTCYNAVWGDYNDLLAEHADV